MGDKKYKHGYTSFIKVCSVENVRQVQLNKTIENYISEREASMLRYKEWMNSSENKHRYAVMIRRLERDIEHARNNKYKQKRINEFNISAMVHPLQSEYNELLISLKMSRLSMVLHVFSMTFF